MKTLGEPKRDGRGAEPPPAPQWLVEVLRPAVRLISRAVWRVRFRGVEHIPAEGGVVIAANHQTYVDPFWITVPVRRPIRYLAWSEAFKWPLAGRALAVLGAWPLVVERGNPSAHRRSLRWLREGGAVMIFPEGGRACADGEMARFKSGAARLALEAGVPVLPVTVRGGHTAWPRGQRWPRAGRVEIIYHPLQHLSARPGEDARRAAQRETETLAATIKSAL
ncbi:MAG TPA: lysophospholipid acyltransferase family protein [Pyrinomonadaceae bacterium]|nr:lysophospholipid acyltransferase family protein [Pyrinomonadaceae bacterium]